VHDPGVDLWVAGTFWLRRCRSASVKPRVFVALGFNCMHAWHLVFQAAQRSITSLSAANSMVL
jgi:hypothetical protein